ncbi:uncharacterized protein BO80DRAFT_436626 [Aspergillus ibericus CBS 121593]|uniref:Uncharacterized protein n=1 Tax=Aspergillus ibericus CBS 121593 TaxID=1448316 RepID=A0A395GXD1_9EURO|nr:hypothetical protein BO80DRAFT_436626 [Aspergillus ibericus CBS 121593]RAK98713.1 hypothetical protein BO80DRAFT_436626 [Aspergillus ibericus CBS 121593]
MALFNLIFMCILTVLIAVYLMPVLTIPLLFDLWPHLNGNQRFLIFFCEIWWVCSCVVFVLAARMMIRAVDAERMRMESLDYNVGTAGTCRDNLWRMSSTSEWAGSHALLVAAHLLGWDAC